MVMTLTSCEQDSTTPGSTTSDPAQPVHKQEHNAKTTLKNIALQVFERDDAVWIKLSTGEEQRLTSRGKGYNINISPNSHWIAIDKATFSNLQVIKLFQRQPNGTYLEMSERNLTTLAWNQWSAMHDIHSDDVINPRARTISWSKDNNGIVIELTGLGPDDEYLEDTLEIDLIEY